MGLIFYWIIYLKIPCTKHTTARVTESPRNIFHIMELVDAAALHKRAGCYSTGDVEHTLLLYAGHLWTTQ